MTAPQGQEEYVRTTNDLRAAYIWLDDAEREITGAEFDRWLAAEKAAVWDAAIDGWSQTHEAYQANPYRQEVN